MKNTLFISIIILVLFYSCNNNSTGNNKDTKTQKLSIIFDVPSLIDLDIDAIIDTLGIPTYNTEPTEQQLKLGVEEWDKTYQKDGYELLITYNPQTRKVIDFFIPTNNSNGKTNNYNNLQEISNTLNNSEISITPVKTLQDPNYYTGIKISKK